MVVSLHRPSILSISPFPFIFVIPLFILHLVSCPSLSPWPCLSFSDSAIVFIAFSCIKAHIYLLQKQVNKLPPCYDSPSHVTIIIQSCPFVPVPPITYTSPIPTLHSVDRPPTNRAFSFSIAHHRYCSRPDRACCISLRFTSFVFALR